MIGVAKGETSMIYDLQKASVWKRFAAWLLDNILVSILVVGIAFLLSSVLGYDHYSDRVSEIYDQYEAKYGVSFTVGPDEYESWTEEERQTFDQAYQELVSDEEAMYAYNMTVNLTMVVTSLSILIAVVALEFVVPLLFKNGQTIGKKIFSLCVIRIDCVKMNNLQLFTRSVLGKFAIETMIPIYILLMFFWGIMDLIGLVILVALVLAELIILIATRKNQAIHDLLAGTAVADYSSQMIFGSSEDLTEYKKKIHAELAARQEY